MIKHVFEEVDVAAIESIPLSTSPQSDTLIWPFIAMGQYSVKSGYRFLHDQDSPE